MAFTCFKGDQMENIDSTRKSLIQMLNFLWRHPNLGKESREAAVFALQKIVSDLEKASSFKTDSEK
jgi:hypothetical protein